MYLFILFAVNWSKYIKTIDPNTIFALKKKNYLTQNTLGLYKKTDQFICFVTCFLVWLFCTLNVNILLIPKINHLYNNYFMKRRQWLIIIGIKFVYF